MHLTALGIAAAKALVPASEAEDEAAAGAAAEAGERQGVLTLTESRAFAGRVDERPLHSCWVVLRRGVLLYAPVTPSLPLTLPLTQILTLTLTLTLTLALTLTLTLALTLTLTLTLTRALTRTRARWRAAAPRGAAVGST